MELLIALLGVPVIGFASFISFLLSAPYAQGHILVKLIHYKSRCARWREIEREIDQLCFTASQLIIQVKKQEGPSRTQMREVMKYLKIVCDLLDEKHRLSDQDVTRLRTVLEQAEHNLRLTLDNLAREDTTGFPETVAALETVVCLDPYHEQARSLEKLERLMGDVGGGSDPQQSRTSLTQ